MCAARARRHSIGPIAAETVLAETRSSTLVGGVRSAAAGGIHPLGYLHGMAAGVEARGIPIPSSTPALRIKAAGAGVIVDTTKGSVRARQAVIGAVFALISAFDEPIIALFISGGQYQTLTKRMFTALRDEIDPTIAAIGTLMTAASVCNRKMPRRLATRSCVRCPTLWSDTSNPGVRSGPASFDFVVLDAASPLHTRMTEVVLLC